MPLLKRDPELAAYDSMPVMTPFIETPYTKVSAHWMTWQRSPCADYEYDWSLCASRVGVKEGMKVCKELFEDFNECIFRNKSIGRFHAMQAERKKQGRPYLEKPPMDSIRTWVKKDN
ncbi:hypothetical protein HELRODRAFT_159767 [Helobdella robusta]|uniref:Uncharacterized protein n=1 Tax=Helobdella robusta TaxID=6412 RepID=T1EPD9_HELRO|nr:hypothetical protein HELRODRAFT_159767 [Helobdella robusta]ESO13143.1 hypothetical protein HELRODRAFT_159767 [Helobdella robusta]